MRFKGKTAIVTGAGRGIGAAIAHRLGREGSKVVIFDIDGDSGASRLASLRNEGVEALFVRGDVSNEADVARCVKETVETFGRVDVLVNNAGIGFSGKPIFEQTLEEWWRVISVNLTGPYLFAKYATEVMVQLGGGVIVNIVSTRALQSEPNTEPYTASKGGLLALTHALAVSLSPYRIRVVSVSPGWVDTSEWQVPPRTPSLSNLDHTQHPAGRVGRPEDVAALVAFLASDEASWITGVNFVIDGGMTTRMIYLDDLVIAESLAKLTGDLEFAELVRKAAMRSDLQKVKEVLKTVLESSTQR
ncbi:MAG: SDR family oxidoreductase [Thermofilaceae archaeon]|nr:SDR family oxidoreductase [Thermofilaceae archaeon]MCX8180275.1 SDR family oxidoreductase [Thermofilaceae archaeon]MDW8004005.1 SDR family oxidoreductase [Thermofilaceae archaeon]